MFGSASVVAGTGRGLALVLLLAGAAAGSGAALAEPLAAPAGEVILTVGGKLGQTNSPEGAVFDLAMLESLAPVEIETSTIWTDGVQVFRGVPLAVLLARLEAEGEVIRARALNDYTVEIPVADAVEGGPILAFEQNGKPLSVRDKGPLWVVYPYDAVTDYQSEVIYARSIWQVARMDVE